MVSRRLCIDSGLLVLLVVGQTGEDLIAKHRVLQRFRTKDYRQLVHLLSQFDQCIVTPNVLTETSNLLAQHADPERSKFFRVLHALINGFDFKEIVVQSKTASNNGQFIRLGLTDAALLEVVSKSTPLITVDLDLYLAATRIDSACPKTDKSYTDQ